MTVPELIEEARRECPICHGWGYWTDTPERQACRYCEGEGSLYTFSAAEVLQGDLDKLREALREIALPKAYLTSSSPEPKEIARAALALLSLPDEETQPEELGGQQKLPVSKATGAKESETR